MVRSVEGKCHPASATLQTLEMASLLSFEGEPQKGRQACQEPTGAHDGTVTSKHPYG